MATVTLTTAEELARLPRGRVRYELVKGELRTMSPAGAKHGAVAMIIGSHLFQFVKQHNLGHVFAAETGFKIEGNPDSVRAADVAFVSLSRLPTIPDSPSFLQMAPDLAIEVLSPSDRESEWTDKSSQWLSAGTRAVIIVNPASRTVQVLSADSAPVNLTDADVLELPSIVSGWKMSVREMLE